MSYLLHALAVWIRVYACVGLLYIKGKSSWNFIYRWKFIIILIVFMIVTSYFARPYREGLLLLIQGLGALILIWESGGEKKSKVLLYGYAVTLAFSMIFPLADIGVIEENYWLAMLRGLRIENVPFLLASLYYIDATFAQGFADSEQLSRSLDELNKSLDELVQNKTAALIEEQNQKQQMMLNIFHDLRNPLFTLKGCAERLTAENRETRERIDIIKERISFVAKLTEDLFLEAKLKDEKILIEPEAIELNPTLNRIVMSTQLAATEKNITITYREKSPGCMIWADPYRLNQILENLICNAIYYTKPEGKIRVIVQRCEKEIRISVTDTGKGIDAEEMKYIFNRYYTTGGKDKHSSTGLGLSIANELVKLHRGRIEVESQYGKGTSFHVFFPEWKEQ
jgi:signal transduction histidine kinase